MWGNICRHISGAGAAHRPPNVPVSNGYTIIMLANVTIENAQAPVEQDAPAEEEDLDSQDDDSDGEDDDSDSDNDSD